MNKGIFYNIIGILIVLAIIFFKIPAIWVIVGFFALLIFTIFNPFRLSVEKIPKGFTEKKFNTGKVILNYIEGPNNGEPLLFIPGQTEFWQGYKLVIPYFQKNHHVFVVDIRGHGKSTKTPGKYSYNIIGEDLKEFLENVIKKPAIVSGLSSGAILSIWLGANAPKSVSAIISEDPPLFSSMYPRIKKEIYMYRMFKTMIDTLEPKRDIKSFFLLQGIPHPKGRKELLLIPPWIANFITGLFYLNKKFRPKKKYDVPLAPYSGRAGFKFLSEYDVDFSKATIDGRLTKGFNPESTLKKIKCPMLLIQAKCTRDKNWGIIGALEDKDVEKIKSIVKNLKVEKVDSFHDVHLSKPKIFIKVVNDYLNNLKRKINFKL